MKGYGKSLNSPSQPIDFSNFKGSEKTNPETVEIQEQKAKCFETQDNIQYKKKQKIYCDFKKKQGMKEEKQRTQVGYRPNLLMNSQDSQVISDFNRNQLEENNQIQKLNIPTLHNYNTLSSQKIQNPPNQPVIYSGILPSMNVNLHQEQQIINSRQMLEFNQNQDNIAAHHWDNNQIQSTSTPLIKPQNSAYFPNGFQNEQIQQTNLPEISAFENSVQVLGVPHQQIPYNNQHQKQVLSSQLESNIQQQFQTNQQEKKKQQITIQNQWQFPNNQFMQQNDQLNYPQSHQSQYQQPQTQSSFTDFPYFSSQQRSFNSLQTNAQISTFDSIPLSVSDIRTPVNKKIRINHELPSIQSFNKQIPNMVTTPLVTPYRTNSSQQFLPEFQTQNKLVYNSNLDFSQQQNLQQQQSSGIFSHQGNSNLPITPFQFNQQPQIGHFDQQKQENFVIGHFKPDQKTNSISTGSSTKTSILNQQIPNRKKISLFSEKAQNQIFLNQFNKKNEKNIISNNNIGNLSFQSQNQGQGIKEEESQYHILQQKPRQSFLSQQVSEINKNISVLKQNSQLRTNNQAVKEEYQDNFNINLQDPQEEKKSSSINILKKNKIKPDSSESYNQNSNGILQLKADMLNTNLQPESEQVEHFNFYSLVAENQNKPDEHFIFQNDQNQHQNQNLQSKNTEKNKPNNKKQPQNKQQSQQSNHNYYAMEETTKNLLRNFGHAQTKYILTHDFCREKIKKYFKFNAKNINSFDKWVKERKLETFQQFRQAWYIEQKSDCEEFQVLYRELCFNFYENQASIYAIGSQIKYPRHKKTHIKYIHKFMTGILNPAKFYQFKEISTLASLEEQYYIDIRNNLERQLEGMKQEKLGKKRRHLEDSKKAQNLEYMIENLGDN